MPLVDLVSALSIKPSRTADRLKQGLTALAWEMAKIGRAPSTGTPSPIQQGQTTAIGQDLMAADIGDGAHMALPVPVDHARRVSCTHPPIAATFHSYRVWYTAPSCLRSGHSRGEDCAWRSLYGGLR